MRVYNPINIHVFGWLRAQQFDLPWLEVPFLSPLCTILRRERGVNPDDENEQLTALARSAEWVDVPEEKIENILSDPDDNVVVACAVEGRANYLVTYDPHFDTLNGDYRGIKIVKAIPFLEVLRESDK